MRREARTDQDRVKIAKSGITPRRQTVPFVVFRDATAGASRSVNPLHVQTFIASPFKKGETIITFANGDAVTIAEDFEFVFKLLTGFVDG
jgi:hypothetical protein